MTHFAANEKITVSPRPSIECPVCQSVDVEGGAVEVNEFTAVQDNCRCHTCDATWSEVFALHGFMDLQRGDHGKTPEQLKATFGGMGGHPFLTRQRWVESIQAGSSMLSYWEWLHAECTPPEPAGVVSVEEGEALAREFLDQVAFNRVPDVPVHKYQVNDKLLYTGDDEGAMVLILAQVPPRDGMPLYEVTANPHGRDHRSFIAVQDQLRLLGPEDDRPPVGLTEQQIDPSMYDTYEPGEVAKYHGDKEDDRAPYLVRIVSRLVEADYSLRYEVTAGNGHMPFYTTGKYLTKSANQSPESFIHITATDGGWRKLQVQPVPPESKKLQIHTLPIGSTHKFLRRLLRDEDAAPREAIVEVIGYVQKTGFDTEHSYEEQGAMYLVKAKQVLQDKGWREPGICGGYIAFQAWSSELTAV